MPFAVSNMCESLANECSMFGNKVSYLVPGCFSVWFSCNSFRAISRSSFSCGMKCCNTLPTCLCLVISSLVENLCGPSGARFLKPVHPISEQTTTLLFWGNIFLDLWAGMDFGSQRQICLFLRMPATHFLGQSNSLIYFGCDVPEGFTGLWKLTSPYSGRLFFRAFSPPTCNCWCLRPRARNGLLFVLPRTRTVLFWQKSKRRTWISTLLSLGVAAATTSTRIVISAPSCPTQESYSPWFATLASCGCSQKKVKVVSFALRSVLFTRRFQSERSSSFQVPISALQTQPLHSTLRWTGREQRWVARSGTVWIVRWLDRSCILQWFMISQLSFDFWLIVNSF